MDKIDVRKIAALARVELDETELKLFGEQFSSILSYIRKLDELDLKDTEPVSHPFNIKNVYREDEVREDKDFSRKFLQIAPDTAKDMVKVPAVIEGK